MEDLVQVLVLSECLLGQQETVKVRARKMNEESKEFRDIVS